MTQDSDVKPIKSTAKSVLQSIFSWPTFAVLVVLLFWKPLHQIGELIPRLVENSDTITLGKFTLQIRQSLKTLANQAGPEVREALSGMEAEDALTIIENKLVDKMYYSGEVGDAILKWQRPKRLGLVEELGPDELRKAEEEDKQEAGYYKFGVRPTAKYDKVYKFLSRAVYEIVNASIASPIGPKGKE